VYRKSRKPRGKRRRRSARQPRTSFRAEDDPYEEDEKKIMTGGRGGRKCGESHMDNPRRPHLREKHPFVGVRITPIRKRVRSDREKKSSRIRSRERETGQ